jgi:hypothetical protein
MLEKRVEGFEEKGKSGHNYSERERKSHQKRPFEALSLILSSLPV